MPPSIAGWLYTVITILFGRKIADVTVKTIYTDNNHESNYLVQGVEGATEILINCQQLKHVVKPHSVLLPTKIFYTYDVTATKKVNEYLVCIATRTFPHMCSFWLRHSKIPHALAISAFLDTVTL